MRYLSFIIILVLFSCDTKKVIQLPEIENAEITEVLDVSPAYIFYDETQPDSTLFNRKNLISTTNWLVNVDKRLTLKQAIPHIQYLQNKRRKASMHKNENAKNYFTCNDTSIKNLGFLEFTGVEYHFNVQREDVLKHSVKKQPTLLIQFNKNKKNIFFDLYAGKINLLDASKFKKITSATLKEYSKVILAFESDMNFSTYISIKSKIENIKSAYLTINTNEFFY